MGLTAFSTLVNLAYLERSDVTLTSEQMTHGLINPDLSLTGLFMKGLNV